MVHFSLEHEKSVIICDGHNEVRINIIFESKSQQFFIKRLHITRLTVLT